MDRFGVDYKSVSLNDDKSKPTSNVLPIRTVGARRLPVGPNRAATFSSVAFPPGKDAEGLLMVGAPPGIKFGIWYSACGKESRTMAKTVGWYYQRKG